MKLTDYKPLFIYTYSSLLSESGGIKDHSREFWFHSGEILWNPVEWMHSCRNLWGIQKYRVYRLDNLWEHARENPIPSLVPTTYISWTFACTMISLLPDESMTWDFSFFAYLHFCHCLDSIAILFPFHCYFIVISLWYHFYFIVISLWYYCYFSQWSSNDIANEMEMKWQFSSNDITMK